MAERVTPSRQGDDEDRIIAQFGHPRGTLAIVIVYGALFVLGWLGMYLGRFLAHGAPHP
jgi:hypothetical protein